MKLSQFRFHLPPELIANQPSKNRDDVPMLILDRKAQTIEHGHFKDILPYFGDGDVFIINNTKVFPARLYGEKEKTGAKIEVFLLRELNRESRLWDVLVDPARKIRIGNKLYFGDDDSLVGGFFFAHLHGRLQHGSDRIGRQLDHLPASRHRHADVCAGATQQWRL